jgi:Ras-related GTP-binding protein A/B
VRQNSKSAKIFCLVHKMDLIPDEQREQVFVQRESELQGIAEPLGLSVQCFKTSIWDETLYRAWSQMVYSLIPNRDSLQSELDQLCRVCHADEVGAGVQTQPGPHPLPPAAATGERDAPRRPRQVVLFERATFLVISNAVRIAHSDVHRFEKVSNIIKQFKLSCSKTQAQFQAMEVRNSHFTAFIDYFTTNTYVMVIMSDPSVQTATTQLNIKAARKHFEQFISPE